MQLIRGLGNIRARHKHCIATIGNFDGVHRGHRAIIKKLKDKAKGTGAPVCVVTFEPQPREFFRQQQPSRLSSLREKLILLSALDVDQVLCMPFGDALRAISADDFVRNILVNGLAVRSVIVGDDFHYGYGREGNFHHLQIMGRQFCFDVSDTQTITRNESGRISSTAIRQALVSGDLNGACYMLGHHFIMAGRAVRGKQLGSKLGFPTANLCWPGRLLPLQGVFAVRVTWQGQVYNGVANIGVRPTVNTRLPLLEVHLLDFSPKPLYGEQLKVSFIERIRKEQRFSSLDELTCAIKQDIIVARRILRHKASF
ncbi:Riboflavin biosynthesis protein RibF [invertebrate metagenome]|uniref:Bifunctional riboflavin kinase/FMN adenylyltransferase n=1 Tax=invertebrate metagenome TaxID=1711999 RepID=A0A2H9TA17_9ZZZZ